MSHFRVSTNLRKHCSRDSWSLSEAHGLTYLPIPLFLTFTWFMNFCSMSVLFSSVMEFFLLYPFQKLWYRLEIFWSILLFHISLKKSNRIMIPRVSRSASTVMSAEPVFIFNLTPFHHLTRMTCNSSKDLSICHSKVQEPLFTCTRCPYHI
jgi:hypothetical protein